MTADRLYPTRPFLAASVAVFRENRVLVAARARPPLDTVYGLPGGLVEPGETLGQAALRELREEVGVEAALIGFVAPIEFIERDDEGRVRHHFVICAHAARWTAGEPQAGEEARDVRWVREDDVAMLPITPGLAGVLRQAFVMNEMVS